MFITRINQTACLESPITLLYNIDIINSTHSTLTGYSQFHKHFFSLYGCSDCHVVCGSQRSPHKPAVVN